MSDTPDSPEVEAARVRNLDAEAKQFLAEARRADLEASRVALALEEQQEKRVDARAVNKHHGLYMFSSDVGAGSVQACIDQLTKWLRLTPQPAKVEIVFNSPGGGVIDGMALFDYIRFVSSQGIHVTTSTIGYAASMAGILLQAGDERIMGRESWLMIHQASFGMMGKSFEVQDRADWVKRQEARILEIFAERSKMTKAQLKGRWERREWWVSSSDALKWGLVDEVR